MSKMRLGVYIWALLMAAGIGASYAPSTPAKLTEPPQNLGLDISGTPGPDGGLQYVQTSPIVNYAGGSCDGNDPGHNRGWNEQCGDPTGNGRSWVFTPDTQRPPPATFLVGLNFRFSGKLFKAPLKPLWDGGHSDQVQFIVRHGVARPATRSKPCLPGDYYNIKTGKIEPGCY